MSKSMDINPLIADLHKYKDELVNVMEICLGLGDKNFDEYVARDLLGIRGEADNEKPFPVIAEKYNLSVEEVTNNIRSFAKSCYKNILFEGLPSIKELEFDSESEIHSDVEDMKFSIGDEVIVKKGVIDPDFGIYIEGWTGEIIQIGRNSDSRPSCLIKWDNDTVNAMSPEHLAACDRANLVHTCMFLAESDIALH